MDRGPVPESVRELNSPLDIPFLPLAPFPWAFTALQDSLRESLKLQRATLPPFFRDTQGGLHLRLYYFNRDHDATPPRGVVCLGVEIRCPATCLAKAPYLP